MPILKAATGSCGDRQCNECSWCAARVALTEEDWYALEFYVRVADQYINQAPMGTEDGRSFITLRIEAVAAALRLYGYPRTAWAWLADTAAVLHRLVHRMDVVPASELRALRLADVVEPDE